jgi:hypothetical protein
VVVLNLLQVEQQAAQAVAPLVSHLQLVEQELQGKVTLVEILREAPAAVAVVVVHQQLAHKVTIQKTVVAVEMELLTQSQVLLLLAQVVAVVQPVMEPALVQVVQAAAVTVVKALAGQQVAQLLQTQAQVVVVAGRVLTVVAVHQVLLSFVTQTQTQ